VNLHDQVPVLIFHVLEADIPEDTGVVDEHIDAAEGVDGGLDDLVTILDGVVVGNGVSAGLFDLVDDNIGGLSEMEATPVSMLQG
jgi:hypothetical protein